MTHKSSPALFEEPNRTVMNQAGEVFKETHSHSLFTGKLSANNNNSLCQQHQNNWNIAHKSYYYNLLFSSFGHYKLLKSLYRKCY